MQALAGTRCVPQQAGFSRQHTRVVCKAGRVPQVSERVRATDAPVIVQTKALIAAAPPGRQVLSLAQGVVFWPPPPAALEVAGQLLAASGSAIHLYGPDEGLPALRDALAAKLAAHNSLHGYEVMVTAGANQGFTNLVLALCDASDHVALFSPYYFNHYMALQMTGGADKVLLGPCHPDTLRPDLGWLQQQLSGPTPPRMVVITSPCNPTGVVVPAEELEAAAAMCAASGAWLVLDSTYEDFVYDGASHHSVRGPNVISLFSFSKAYGMSGWRVGYLAYPGQQLLGYDLGAQLLKVQDTVPVCPTQLSQHMALAALTQGRDYVASQIAGLSANRALIADALSPLGAGRVFGGQGAIYMLARLPDQFGGRPLHMNGSGGNGSSSGSHPAADEAVVEWLVNSHGVCVLPGSSCGAPGHVRVAFANLQPELCRQAAARLKAGLTQLVGLDGPAALVAAVAATSSSSVAGT